MTPADLSQILSLNSNDISKIKINKNKCLLNTSCMQILFMIYFPLRKFCNCAHHADGKVKAHNTGWFV